MVFSYKTASNKRSIKHGWNNLPHGAGGLILGFDIANDGSMVCRSDVGNAYIWSGTTATTSNPDDRWIPLLTLNSFKNITGNPVTADVWGAMEVIFAPNNSNKLWGIFPDVLTGTTNYPIYYSTDRGATWSKSNLSSTNMDSNNPIGYDKNSFHRMMVDPANENVVYAGLPPNNGKTSCLYTTLNKSGGSVGSTFFAATSDSGSTTPLPQCKGGVNVLSITSGGTGGTNGSYTNVTTTTLTGTGLGATLNITVTGGIVTSAKVFVNGSNVAIDGGGYSIGDTISVTGITGLTGVVLTVGSLQDSSGGNGMVFDTSSGTTTVGGQTVTSRIICPISGWDVYESFDGGNTWTGTGAPTAFGATNSKFKTYCGVINSNGVYYIVVDTVGIFRYTKGATAGSGTWTDITPATPGNSTYLIVDPSDSGYLSVTGERGLTYGWTSLNADTTHVWSSSTGTSGSFFASVPAYDIQYLNNIFQMGSNLIFGPQAGCAKIDNNGNTIWVGNQSVWITTGRIVYSGNQNLTGVSFGRGQECTVSQEAFRPSGATYPIACSQDLGGPVGGTWDTYPTTVVFRGECTASSIEDSPTDGTFVAIRLTAQNSNTDHSAYSTDGGITWTPYPTMPNDVAWVSNVTGGTGGVSSTTLIISAVSSSTLPFIGQTVSVGGVSQNVTISALGIVNTDGTGTYTLSGALTIANGTSITLDIASKQCGQIVVVDNDHHIIACAGFGNLIVPAVTTDRGNTWTTCKGLPSSAWLRAPWFFTPVGKPIAAGWGADVGTVYAAVGAVSNTTITVYKSTDFGQNFSPTLNTITCSPDMTACYVCTVPGQSGHVWLSGSFTGGSPSAVWKSTDYGDTWVQQTIPASLPSYISIGATDPNGGTYPTIWLRGSASFSSPQILYYSTDGASTWKILGSSGTIGYKADLPSGQDLYGLGAIRADRQVFKKLYAGAGQCGFVFYNP